MHVRDQRTTKSLIRGSTGAPSRLTMSSCTFTSTFPISHAKRIKHEALRIQVPPSLKPQLPLIRGYKWVCRAAVDEVEAPAQEVVGISDGENYYAVLGLSPGASQKDIKKAYYTTMRDFHPDISTDEDSTEFCIFLNEVYETLSDPESRAAYDEIAGFNVDAINPFLDTSYPADKVFVDEFACIGCKNCCNVCPSSFKIEDLFGRARVQQQGKDGEDMLQEAIDTCPVNCIHWVTAPQLTLLENQMAKIEMVSAYILLMGCHTSGRCVFREASEAFEKRQADLRARLDANETQDWMSEMGFNTNFCKSDDYDVRRRAAAAKAAASARRWRNYQQRQRDREALYLSD